MSTAGSADCFRFRGSFEGCISGHDSNFSHRPYHKDCRCALHDKSRRLPGDLPPPPRCDSVSFSGRRRSRSHGSLAMAVSGGASSRDSVVGFATSGEGFVFCDLILGELGNEETTF